MNKVKEELRNVLEDEQRFTAQSEQQVFEKIAQKKERHSKWKIPTIVASLATICALLFIFLPQMAEEQSATPVFDAFVFDDTMNVIVNMADVWQKGDILVAYSKKEEPSIVMTKYFVYEGEEWVQRYATTHDWESEYHWVKDNRLFSGVVHGSYIENVMLDDKIVIYLPEHSYWVGLAEEPVAHVKYVYEKDSPRKGSAERIAQKDEYSFDGYYPFVRVAPITQLEGTERMMYKSDNMARFNHDYSLYPIVVNPNATEIERGDIVRYINAEGEMVVSRIVGLPRERFEVKNGTVVIDDFVLNIDLSFAKVNGFMTIEDYKLAFKGQDVDLHAVSQVLHMDVDAINIGANEYVVVPDNWLRGKIELVKASAIRGTVLGYDKAAFEDEWSADELALYDTFKKSYDLDVLVGADPITIARLYSYAQMVGDDETEYELLTSREGHVQWTFETHMAEKEYAWPSDPISKVEFARELAEGEWIPTSEYEGYIKMEREDGEWLGFQMVQAENGAWEVGFLPIQ